MLATQTRLDARLDQGLVRRLRAVSLRGLSHMYVPSERLFCHCVRRGPAGDALEGLSRRYTAITLLGLADEPEAAVAPILGDHTRTDVLSRLLADVSDAANLGDVALTLWAAAALQADGGAAYERLRGLRPEQGAHPAVELAWALSALTLSEALPGAARLRDALADKLLTAHDRETGLFRHTVGGRGPALRGHVACFADIVYPVQALSFHAKATGDERGLAAAARCARRACELMGAGGQWWWHYDVRTGQVVEGYPVYSVHQDAMAPMALFALEEAGGPSHTEAVRRGLEWLVHVPELDGRSLIDERAEMIWRKVARREPRKLTRQVQAVASALHPSLRVPGADTVFPPVQIDWECRPYHLGWLLYAFSHARLARWGWTQGGDA